MRALPPARPFTTSSVVSNRDQQQVQPQVVEQSAPQVVQRVSVQQTPSRTDLLVDESHWEWEELRDFVVGQITERFGPFPRDARKEFGIFSRFLKKYGSAAPSIAKHAFGPSCDGWWGRAPISVNRFSSGSDSYFADIILSRLQDVDQNSSNR